MNKLQNFPKIIFYFISSLIVVISLSIGLSFFDTSDLFLACCTILTFYFFYLLVYEINTYSITIEDDKIVFTSTIKRKSFNMNEIEIFSLLAGIAARNVFSLKISTNKSYSFRLFYTTKNYTALKELISHSKKSNITIQQLDSQIDKSSCGYPS